MQLLRLVCVVFFAVLSVAVQARADQILETAQKEAFLAFDTNQDGRATAQEMVTTLFSLFAAADNDQSGGVSLDEFKVISLGYAYVAESTGKVAAYEASRTLIFKRWDKNGDGMLSQPEMVGGSMLENLESADFGLSQAEYFKTKYVAEMTDALK